AHLNLQLARAYLAATDPMVAKRTWQVPMEELAKTKRGATYERWQYVVKDKAFDLIRKLANSGDPGGAFSSRVGGWDRFDQRVPAPHPQLCVGRGLAALAGHRKAPVAEHPLPGKARSHPRGTSGHHGTGEEPGVACVLRAALAAWRCAIGRRYVARGRRRLVAARHFLFSKKNGRDLLSSF